MSTSGILLGHSRDGSPAALRLFRPQPTRVFTCVRDYMKWVLIFRSVALGAHITLVTTNPRAWTVLVQALQACGGTVEVTSDPTAIPGQGRPYRPSLVVDDSAEADGARMSLGVWQSVLVLEDAASSSAIHAMRACDVTLVSPRDGRVSENMKRGLALNSQLLKQTNNLAENELIVAMPRRLERITMPPTTIEYQMLFGG